MKRVPAEVSGCCHHKMILLVLEPLICLQDTIKNPGENGKMKKATLRGIATTTFFYAAIGFIGYAAFGNLAPGNLISG